MAGAQRPTVATVFAILNIVFGGIFCIVAILAVIGVAALIASGMYLTAVLTLLSIVVGVLLLISGIFLIMNKSNAVQFCLYYVVASVVVALINIIIKIVSPQVIMGVKIGLGVGDFIGLIYPALIFFLVIKNEAVKKFYA
jgi:hypothetical protein